MPVDSNGNYSLPPGYLAVSGQTILASQHNPPFEDVASALSQVLYRSGVAPMGANLRMASFKVTGLGDATDPGDAVTKSQLDQAIADAEAEVPTLSTKSGDYEGLDADYYTSFRFTSAATFSIEDAADLRDNWFCEVWAEAQVTIDPNSTQTINGATTLVLQAGQKAIIFKTGATAFRAFVTSDSFSGPQLQDYRGGLGLSNSGSDAANDITVAVGSAAADASPYPLIRLTTSLTKRIDAVWAAGTNQGGLDTGSVSNSTYYVWLIQRPDTLASDILFSLSATSPTLPANYTLKRLIGSVIRTSAVNGAPFDINNVSAAQVAALTATFVRGDIGTYAMLSGSTGGIASGSVLFYCDAERTRSGQPSATSVWRRMGFAEFTDSATIWLRIT